MYTYDMYSWVAFFAVYCFIGWAGESLYESVKFKKWINRGFLNGPFLPIYGSGAIIILFASLPVRHNAVLVFIFGMLAATVLEYLTGWVMETIFKVRYWDYTVQPFNLNGYICLGTSIAWGVCAEILIFFLHKPIEKFVLGIDKNVLRVIVIIFAVYFVVDVVLSAQEAFNLRKLIKESIANNEELRRLQKRLDVVIAVIDDSKEKFKNNMDQKRQEMKDDFEQKRQEFRDDIEQKYQEIREDIDQKKLEREQKRQNIRSEFDEEISKLKAEIAASKEKLAARRAEYESKNIRILKRNPGARIGKDRRSLKDLFK
ncbi:MAG: hypothetical protein ACI4D8_08300 [Wujia sp.]